MIYQVVALAAFAAAYGDNDVDACQAFADQFDNTCDNSANPTTLALTESVDWSCDGVDDCVSTGTWNDDQTTCTWQRKLCVTCSQKGKKSYIRVQTNGLPNHCYDSSIYAPAELDIDFEVYFNWDVKSKHYQTPTTLDETEELLCTQDTVQDSTIPDKADYSSSGSQDMSNIAGVMLNGVVFYSGVWKDEVDPHYPAVYGSVTDTADLSYAFDRCYGIIDSNQIYHYHMMTPCMTDSTLGETSSMFSGSNFAENALAYYQLTNTTYNSMGIAKDGHKVMGPSYDDATVDDCDVDACNGMFDDDENYVYMASTFHPYMVGCFGPAYTNNFEATCTDNARYCSTATGAEFLSAFTVASVSLASLAYNF